MMYSSVAEAFNNNNTFGKQINSYKNKNKNKFCNNQQSFFNAQGDLDINPFIHQQSTRSLDDQDWDNLQNKNGSSIIDLQKRELEEINNIKKMSLRSIEPKKHFRPKYSHKYYIKKFIQEINDDEDLISMTSSSQSDSVFDHVKKCKYCKSEINKKLKQSYLKSIKSKENVVKVVQPEKVNISSISNILPQISLGYDIKEIMMIFIIGIILIFILDLCVKIGKKALKND